MDRPQQININLLERRERIQAHIVYLGLGMLLTAAILVWSGNYYVGHSRVIIQLQAENADLNNQLASNSQENVLLAFNQDNETKRIVKKQTVKSLELRRVSYTELINEIDRVIPPSITMVGFDAKGNRVILTGFSPDHTQVARLMEGLKNIACLHNFNIFDSELNEQTNEVKYTIELDWEAEHQ